jgi:hypothetical protein
MSQRDSGVSSKGFYLFIGISWTLGIIFLVASYFAYNYVFSRVIAFLLLMVGSNIVSMISFGVGYSYAETWSPLAYFAPVGYLFGYAIVWSGVNNGMGLYATWVTNWFFIINLVCSIVGATVLMLAMVYAKNPWMFGKF